MGLKKFDGKINGNNKKVPIIVITVAILVLGGFIAFFVTFAKFKVTNTYNVIEGVVKGIKEADIVVSIKLVDPDGSVRTSTDLPNVLAYDYDSTRTSCDNGSTITFDPATGKYTITAGNTDKCTLYFNHRNSKNIGDAVKVGDYVNLKGDIYRVVSIADDGTVKIRLNSSIGSVTSEAQARNKLTGWYSAPGGMAGTGVKVKYGDFIASLDTTLDISSYPGDLYPKINLKADVALYGTGTETDMFRIDK